MQAFEYKVIPAPNKGKKAKGVKTPEDRFAHGVETILNEMAAEGWEFQRADMLPSDERAGLTGTKTNWRNLLVFRRPLTPAQPPEALAAPSGVAAPVAGAASAAEAISATAEAAPAPPAAQAKDVAATEPAPTPSPEPVEPHTTAPAPQPPRTPAPTPAPTASSPSAAPPVTAIAGDPEAPPEAVQVPGDGARKMISDDGVEEISPVLGLTAALKQRAGLKDPLKEPGEG